MRSSALLSVVVVLPLLAACNSREMEKLGTNVGGQLGSLAGTTLGRPLGGPMTRDIVRTSRNIGASVGGSMARMLSQADLRQLGSATDTALNNAQSGSVRPVAWASDSGSGATGSATVVGAAQPNQSCYDVRQVAFVPGRGQVEQVQKYCSTGDGRWEVV